jgi:[ribosomal protein S5]-alanine N-acetyltransferase
MAETAHHFVLETPRLLIRPFALEDSAAGTVADECFGPAPQEQRQEWLAWQVANYTALARLWQPPYGDRAIIRKRDNALIGQVGFVPSWGPFDTLPSFAQHLNGQPSRLSRPEMGLFWAVRPAERGQGYASEAARAIVTFIFDQWAAQRVVATTEYDNVASQAVMRKLGMSIAHNPHKTPEWFQVVGMLNHP